MTLSEYNFKIVLVSRGPTDYRQDRNVIVFSSDYHWQRFAGRHSNNLATLYVAKS